MLPIGIGCNHTSISHTLTDCLLGLAVRQIHTGKCKMYNTSAGTITAENSHSDCACQLLPILAAEIHAPGSTLELHAALGANYISSITTRVSCKQRCTTAAGHAPACVELCSTPLLHVHMCERVVFHSSCMCMCARELCSTPFFFMHESAPRQLKSMRQHTILESTACSRSL